MTSDPVAVVERARAAIARYDRPDLDARLAARPGPACSTTAPRPGRRRVQAGQEPARQRPGRRAGLPDVRRRRHGRAHRRAARREPRRPWSLVRPDARADDDHGRRRARRPHLRAGQPGQPRGVEPRRGRAAPPRPERRAGDRRHPRRRRADSVHGAATTAMLPTADAVLLVSDAAQEYTAPELEFLAQAVAVCPNVACVLTKTDLYPEWRRIVELDRGHLRHGGDRRDVFGVSSTLRWHAVLHGDADVNAESGFPELDRLPAQAGARAGRPAGPARSTVHDVLAVTEQIASNLRAEQAAQHDPARRAGADPRAHRGAGPGGRAQGAVGALAAHPQRRRRRPQRRHRPRPARPDARGHPAGRGGDRRAAATRHGSGTSSPPGCSSRSRRRRRRTSSGRRSGRAGSPSRSPTHFRRPARGDPARRCAPTPSDALRLGAGDEGRARARRGRWATRRSPACAAATRRADVRLHRHLGRLDACSTRSRSAPGLLHGRQDDQRRAQKRVARRQAEAKTVVRRYVDDVTFQVGKDSRDLAARRPARPARPLHRAGRAAQPLAEGVAHQPPNGGDHHAGRDRAAAGRDRDRAGEAGAVRSSGCARCCPRTSTAARRRSRPRRRRPSPDDRGRTTPARRRRWPARCWSGPSTSTATSRRRRWLPASCAGSTGRCGSRSRARSRRASRPCSTRWSGNRSRRPTPGECTRVVTWYRAGTTPRIVLYPRTGPPVPLPVDRRDGALVIDLGATRAEESTGSGRLAHAEPAGHHLDRHARASPRCRRRSRGAPSRFLDPDDERPPRPTRSST